MDYKNINLEDLAKQKMESATEKVDPQLKGKTDEDIEDIVVSDIHKEVKNIDPEMRKRVDDIKSSINLMDAALPLEFGTGAQKELADFSENILSNVRTKDSGEIGNLLTELMGEVESLEIGEVGEKQNFLQKMFNSASKKTSSLMTRYDSVEKNVTKIQTSLEDARASLVKDIVTFESLYDKNLLYFKEVESYIIAGEEVIEETRNETIPKLRVQAAASENQMDAQLVKDFEETLNRFEKKVHDLKLSQMMAIQTAPQIRLIQNNDRLLVDKIQTAILNTIPLWKSQIVITLGLQSQQQAMELQRNVTDTTNKILKRNSELLKENNAGILEESERGIIDIETLQTVNQNLIDTIEEGIEIQKEGRKKRQLAEAELVKLEDKLYDTLMKKYDE